MKLNKVLSLFDGISCGQIALGRAGIKYEDYLASEIDTHAIKVTQNNYPFTEQLGDVQKLKDVGAIDLLLGGSPCQGFSFSGKKLNFKDPRSKLFFEYLRLLEESNPRYFILENVKMSKESEKIISNSLGVEPIEINSNLFSAQNRPRLYWTNIPFETNIPDKNICLWDIVDRNKSNYVYIDPEKTVNRVNKVNYMQYDINGRGNGSQDQRAFYMDGKCGCLTTNPTNFKLLEYSGKVRYITRLEAERLQTVPENYTRSISTNKAISCLGNGWTVDVIAHILKGLI